MNRSTRALVSLSVVGATVAALSAVTSNSAQAFPPYAQKEGKQCVYCHVGPTGGKRNYRGVFYKANDLAFKNFDDATEAKKAGVEIGPDATPNPKSWTAPAGTGSSSSAAGTNGANSGTNGGVAEKKVTVAAATAKVKTTEAAYKKKPKDAATKKAYAAALADLGHATMLDQSLPPAKRYPAALAHSRKALSLDPTNKQALADKKLIEDAYKQMGRPVPGAKK